MIKITPHQIHTTQQNNSPIPPSPRNFPFPPPGEGIPLYLLKLFGESCN